MGFAPQLRIIMTKVPAKRQTLLFSATLPPEILTMADRMMKDPVRVTIGQTSQPVSQVVQETFETSHQKKSDLLLEQLEKRTGRVLIFVRTKQRTDQIARWLVRHGFKIAKLHGGCTQGQRKQALEGFRNGSPRIMVATDLAGRGIDVADIEHVINYDLPGTREDYIHRIGRTGRLGKPGTAVNFITPEDIDGRHIISGNKPPARVVFSSKRWRSRR